MPSEHKVRPTRDEHLSERRSKLKMIPINVYHEFNKQQEVGFCEVLVRFCRDPRFGFKLKGKASSDQFLLFAL